MLRQDVLDVVNSGQAWALLGAGASADAGIPDWRTLLDRTLAGLAPAVQEEMARDQRFQRFRDQDNLPGAFGRLVSTTDRETVEAVVRAELETHVIPGAIHSELAQWPMRGYITSNYDDLLEKALRRAGEQGWLSVGNTPREALKVAGDPTNVVWHVHGALGLDTERSRLVISEDDYDELYLDENPVLQQLRGLLLHRRLIVVGFGLADPEFMRLLRRVGRLANPARPILAFSAIEDSSMRRELLEKHNVDVVPYRVTGGSHRQLRELLKTYGGMVLRRSLRFGQAARPVPSHDPETTGLLLYNELLLRQHVEPKRDVVATLLRARVLSLLREPGASLPRLTEDLVARRQLMGTADNAVDASEKVLAIVRGLVDDGSVTLNEASGSIDLTDAGQVLVETHSATSELLREQFANALYDRALALLENGGDAALRVGSASYAFLTDCIQKRALGVAMASWTPRAEYRSYQVVALLQALPIFMNEVNDSDEAIALARVVQDVLTSPTEAESKYIGAALQAQFGVHLLGVDPEALRARIASVERTAFIVDSNVLIDHLARGSIGYEPAHLLTNRLREMGAYVVTTGLLAIEVAEHAAWAFEQSDTDRGTIKLSAVRATTGRGGEGSNAFIDGFVREVSEGALPVTGLRSYLADALLLESASTVPTRDHVERVLAQSDIGKRDLDEWEGYKPDLLVAREEIQERIAVLRRERESYKHERQVKAEAEVLLIVEGIRDRALRLDGSDLDSAFFISNTRILDDLHGAGTPITMRMEAALHFVATLNPITLEEISLITASLLAELADSGGAFVDRRRLNAAFSPLIDASRDDLFQTLDQHRALIAERYGEDADGAFRDVDPLDAPLVLESLYAQTAEILDAALREERRRSELLSKSSTLSAQEREELERHRAQQQLREGAGRSRKRAQQSRRGRGKKKKR